MQHKVQHTGSDKNRRCDLIRAFRREPLTAEVLATKLKDARAGDAAGVWSTFECPHSHPAWHWVAAALV